MGLRRCRIFDMVSISDGKLTAHLAALGAVYAVAVPLLFFLLKKMDGALTETG